MKNATIKYESLRAEVRKLLARGVLVMTQEQALNLVRELHSVIAENSIRYWHVASVNTVEGNAAIMLFSLEEVERLYDEILDFNDRLTAEIISPDSIHIISVHSEDAVASAGGDTTIALIGDWKPIYKEELQFDNNEPGRRWDYQDRFPVIHSEKESAARMEKSGKAASGDEKPALCFLRNTADINLEAEKNSMSYPSGELYEKVMIGLTKPVARWMPDDDSVAKVESLKVEMPHLSEFLDEVLSAMNLAIRFKANRFTLPPMILNGPPGLGKTYGLFALAEALDITMHSLPMSTTGAGFVLTGSERGWRDPEPGLLAKMAAKSEHINPIFILDEFDKAMFNRDYGVNGVEPAILQMLERDSAQWLRDVFLERDLNLSEISYIGSSNKTDQIPGAILDRVKVIEVGYPSIEALQNIYTSILNKALREDFGIREVTVFVGEDIREVLMTGISPRTIRNNAGRILSLALKDARQGDCVEISGRELVSQVKKQAVLECEPGIGFLARI